jgi:hypothetical protein
VLEVITFRDDKRKRFADDWQFALDCKEKGFRMAHDLSVVCGHIIHTGGVLWPDIDAPEMHRVEGQGEAQHKGVALPESATYVLKNISGQQIRKFLVTVSIERRGRGYLTGAPRHRDSGELEMTQSQSGRFPRTSFKCIVNGRHDLR